MCLGSAVQNRTATLQPVNINSSETHSKAPRGESKNQRLDIVNPSVMCMPQLMQCETNEANILTFVKSYKSGMH